VGATITINGSNFVGVTGVTVGGTAATNVVTVSPRQVTCTAPTQTTAGPFNIVLTTRYGSATATNAFSYNPGFGAASSGTGSGQPAAATASTSWVHTPAPADNRVFVFAFWEGNNTNALSTYTGRAASYGATAMTSLGVADMGTGRNRSWLEMFSVAITPGGAAQTITIQATSNTPANAWSWAEGQSASYSVVTTVGTAVTAINAAAQPSLTITSAANHCPICGMANDGAITGFTQTERINDTFMIIGDAPGAASVTFAATGTTFGGSVGADLS
jgi:hypothetical protein